MSDDQFTVHVKPSASDAIVPHVRKFSEPAEAVDYAESQLEEWNMVEGEAYAEIRFNGDREPHSIIFLLEGDESTDTERVYGVFNTPSALWPVYYPGDNPYGVVLDGLPPQFPQTPEGDTGTDEGESDDHDVDEDGTNMDLGAEEDENNVEDDEAEDSYEEDDEAEDEIDVEDDEAEDESADDEEDEEFIPDEDGEDEDEAPAEKDDDGEDESDDEDESEDDESEDENDEDESETEEAELPRLRIFAKMRGPKGWRKRAEIEELNARNVFGMKVGPLIEDEDLTPARQEANVCAHIEFIETDEDREKGLLRMKLPEGITLADFTQAKSGWIAVQVPYPREGE